MSALRLSIEPHPLLDLGAFATTFPAPLSELTTPDWLAALLRLDAAAPVAADDSLRQAIRNLLRHGGYKPTGRGKPASEYLLRAAGEAEGGLNVINPAVDACNAVSLHSGLPISVVDLDRLEAPLRVGLGRDGESYVFNATGQDIALAGLLCLHDAQGPCANGVKDAQRTKTHPGTRRTLTLVWGSNTLVGRTARVVGWYRELLGRLGADTAEVVTH